MVLDVGAPQPTRRCCPLDPPGCGCVRVGGPYLDAGECPRVCGHAFPESWRRVTDPVTNCPSWSWSSARCVDAGPLPDDVAADASDAAGDADDAR